MLLNGKAFHEIDEDHLLSLIGTEEGKTIDFKETAYLPNLNKSAPPDVRDKWKRDLWVDVSAFANANGGWIICGMKEKSGIADDLCGLGEINADGEILRLEQSIKSGIEPATIPGLRLREVPLPKTGKGYAIVIFVPRSPSFPHWVKETKKFHVRRSKGNDEMDLTELRRAFNLSESYETRIKSFHSNRIGAISSFKENDDLPVPLSPEAHLVLHSIPILFADSLNKIDVALFKTYPLPQWMLQDSLTDYANYGQFNLDGFLFPLSQVTTQITYYEGYTQIFRNGIVEYVQRPLSAAATHTTLDILDLENLTLHKLKEILTIQENLGVETPLVFFLSLVKAKNYRLGKQMHQIYRFAEGQPPIDRSNILFPNVVIEDYQQELPSITKNTFDMLWNVGGWNKSASYDNAGNWKRDKNW